MTTTPTTDLPPRRRPVTARTRIMGWVLLLVLAALGVVTFVTWRLLVQATDERMDTALRAEVEEFGTLLAPGVNPATGGPFASVDEMLGAAITYNLARPNEKFLGYVDGRFRYQSRQQAPVLLAQDPAFTALAGSVTEPTDGRYESGAGEVRYLAVPVTLTGDAARGVLVVAYFADQERALADDVARRMLLAGAVTLLIALAGAWVVAGRILAPLRHVVETAHGITETDLSARIPAEGAGNDELGRLAQTVNAMLDRVERGVSAQRRFVDDAGHELRTPITIVRGHLEVMDTGDADDVRATVALVDDELERMNRMVSDLLLLARAEQPAFLHPREVDVGELTEEVRDKVDRLGPRNWALDGPARVVARLDPQRITQALVALADNACRYTGPGDRIGIGSAVVGDELRFTVADSGHGVAPADRERIFDRFARGTGARSEGSGLGLSIVRAIAVAHGGDVTVGDTPGGGATFTVAIPLEGRP